MTTRTRRALVGVAAVAAIGLVAVSLTIAIRAWSAACCATSPVVIDALDGATE